MKNQEKIICVLKGLTLSYLITGTLLLLLALGIWKLQFSEQIVNAGMILSYILSTLAGGFYLGKSRREKKFLWGLLLGILYMVILFLAAIIVNGPSDFMNRSTITSGLICILSGMLGGMLG
ncbi:MAG: TIGR04086 family membrane protein [Lachnospiraceae bacterium]|nr:TIGR04086 family membrane protein [Lachnospiraceae bacterium]